MKHNQTKTVFAKSKAEAVFYYVDTFYYVVYLYKIYYFNENNRFL